MSWYLAPSLEKLISETNERWPDRDKASDGTIGDAAHSARYSQHNPNERGCVTAADIDKDGIRARKLVKELIGDPRVWYVIFDGVIWSRTYNWEPRRYLGSNPHTGHIHVSLKQTITAEKDKSLWFNDVLAAPAPTPPAEEEKDDFDPVRLDDGVVPGKRHPQVRKLQRLLIKAGYGPIPGAVTTYYGKNTKAAVARFHKANPRFAEGQPDYQIGPKGFRHLQREVYNQE